MSIFQNYPKHLADRNLVLQYSSLKAVMTFHLMGVYDSMFGQHLLDHGVCQEDDYVYKISDMMGQARLGLILPGYYDSQYQAFL